MGRPKALLRQVQSGNTFVGHLIRVARESRLDPILVVGRPGADEVAAEVARAGGALVVNAGADRGQLSSILAGLDAADAAGASAVMVLPVDVPLLSTRVLTVVLEAAAADERPIVRAVHKGRHGHPVLFKRAVFAELRAADPLVGARAVVRADPGRVNDVEVDHPGVTLDIDTPEEYRRVFGREL